MHVVLTNNKEPKLLAYHMCPWVGNYIYGDWNQFYLKRNIQSLQA